MIDAKVIEEFEKEVIAERQRADEAHDKYLRALAEADNARKRAERQAEMRFDEQRRSLVTRFLPVMDNLERALQHADGDSGLRAGIEMTHRQMLRALQDSGLQREEPVGETFNPAHHEAVEAVKADAPSGTILTVVQPGYRWGEQLIRPAQVRVAL